MLYLCIQCRRPVTNRQHAITCDRCDQWQHRTCDTGISIYQYRQAVRLHTQIQFVCKPCQLIANASPSTMGPALLKDVHTCTQSDPSANVSPSPTVSPILLREVHTPEMPPSRSDDDQSMLDTAFSIPDQSPDQTMCEPTLPRDVSTPVLPPKPSSTNDDPIAPLPSRSDDLDATTHDSQRIQLSFSSDSDLDLSDLDIIPDQPITYKVLERGGQRGGPLLVSSDCYSYTIKKRSKTSTNWRCSVRSKTFTCPATVRQTGDTFQRGYCNHLHPFDVKLPMRAELRNKFRETSAIPAKMSTRDVVQSAIQDVDRRRRWLLPKFTTMYRSVNRIRANTQNQ